MPGSSRSECTLGLTSIVDAVVKPIQRMKDRPHTDGLEPGTTEFLAAKERSRDGGCDRQKRD